MPIRPRFASLAFAVLAAVPAFAQAPSNNSCGTPLTVFYGVNPQPPAGASGQTFTNVNATNTAAGLFAECDPFNKDVWFLYTAIRTGVHSVSTCTPAGFAAGTLGDTTIGVYAAAACGQGGAAPTLGCNDDSSVCGAASLKSYTQFNAFAGEQYLIRVGSNNAVLSGTFYVNVTDTFILANDFCSMPSPLVPGSYSNMSFEGTTRTTGDSLCGVTNVSDVWFTYTAGVFFGGFDLVLSGSGAVDNIGVYTGTACSPTPIACTGLAHTIALTSGQTYSFRMSMNAEAAPASFQYGIDFFITASPPNDGCGGAFPVTDGVSPQSALDAQYFTNVGATNSAGYGDCGFATANSDVFFSYTATTSGKTEVTTETPAGKIPGSLADTVLFVYDACGGSVLGCDDDGGAGTHSKLEFDAVQGTTYRIRVAGYGAFNQEGSFYLTITPRFTLTLSSPLGAGSFRLKNEKGAPFHVVYNCLTLQQGVYPYGPFFGIEPTLTEIAIQIAYGQAPFLVLLDGAGGYQFDFAGLPPLTVYGVALEFDALGQIAGVSPPASVTIN